MAAGFGRSRRIGPTARLEQPGGGQCPVELDGLASPVESEAVPVRFAAAPYPITSLRSEHEMLAHVESQPC